MPHVTFLGVTVVGIARDQEPLPNLSGRKDLSRNGKVTVDIIVVNGQDRDRDTLLALDVFEMSLFLASSHAWDRRQNESYITTCFEFELQEVVSVSL